MSNLQGLTRASSRAVCLPSVFPCLSFSKTVVPVPRETHCGVAQQADFSFFFDTGGWRRCYVAPERFYDSAAPDQSPVDKLMPTMVSQPALCLKNS